MAERIHYRQRIAEAKARIRKSLKDAPDPRLALALIQAEAYKKLQLSGLSKEDLEMLEFAG